MRFLLYFTAFLVVIVVSGCITSSSNLKNRSMMQPTRQVERAADERPRRKAPIIRYTFLDTLNRENELALSEADFEKVPKSEQSVLSANALPESLYRIQVFASNQIETVREQKKELEKNTDESVLIDYEAPYYKLYAGGFVKRQEAQMVLSKLKKIGYLDAWIVSKKISQ